MYLPPPLRVGLGALALGAATYLILLHDLGSPSLWEPYEIDRILAARESSGSLSSAGVASAISFGSVSAFWARLPSALSGLVAIALCWAWVWRAAGKRHALLAALLLCSMPGFLLLTKLSATHITALPAHLLVLLAYSEFLGSATGGRIFALAAGTAGFTLGSLTLGPALGIVLPALTLLAASLFLGRWKCALGLALIAAIWIPQGYAQVASVTADTAGHAHWALALEDAFFPAFPWVALARLAWPIPETYSQKKRQLITIATASATCSVLAVGVLRYHGHSAPVLILPAVAVLAAMGAPCALREGVSRPHRVLLPTLVALMLGNDIAQSPERLAAFPLNVDAVPLSSLSSPGFLLLACILAALLVIASLTNRLARLLPFGSVALVLAVGLYGSQIWFPQICRGLSHGALTDTLQSARQEGDLVLASGALPGTTRLWDDPPRRASASHIAKLLAGERRVFATVPTRSYCALRQRARSKGIRTTLMKSGPTLSLLSTQHKPGEPRVEALDRVLYYDPIADVEPIASYGDALQLEAIELPKAVFTGDSFKVRTRWRVRRRPRRKWKVFAHFDGPGVRFQADHWPIDNLCPTNHWNPGDVVEDEFTAVASRVPGTYTLWLGLFYGSHGNWKRMPVENGPSVDSRVSVGTIEVRR